MENNHNQPEQSSEMNAVAVTLGDFIFKNLQSRWIADGAPGHEAYYGVPEPPKAEHSACWRVDPNFFWGEEGARSLVRRLAGEGVNRIYWRTMGGGHANYPSLIEQPRVLVFDSVLETYLNDCGRPEGFGDFSTFDLLPVVVDESHRQGIEIYAWFTGCEDDHGSKGYVSKFATANPEYCQLNRMGERLYGNLSFAFPECQAHKRRLIDEFLAAGFDGLLLDCTRANSFGIWKLDYVIARQGERRQAPQGGYEAPVREAFLREYGLDPCRIPEDSPEFELWWRFKSRYYPTPLVRVCADAARAKGIPCEVMIPAKEPLLIHGLDIEHWIDEGWVDALLPAMPGHYYPGATHGYYLDDTASLATMFKALKWQARGRVAVRWTNYMYAVSAILGYHGSAKNHPVRGTHASLPPGPLADALRKRRALAMAIGSDGFVAFEGDHLEALDLWDSLGSNKPGA